MKLRTDLACLCSTGKMRKKNEDNFFFDGEYLHFVNNGSDGVLSKKLSGSDTGIFALFDGMGGENYGELAAFAAAKAMSQYADRLPGDCAELEELCLSLNAAVLEKAREMFTRHMGTTLVAMVLNRGRALICNVGDSRAYLVRGGRIRQLSEDHVERHFAGSKKPGLGQYLGVDPEEFIIEACCVEEKMQPGDSFLLCSDGVTDMLSPEEILSIIEATPTAEDCVSGIVDAALDKGGRDNITAIVCKVKKARLFS